MSSVATDILGVSGRAMLAALIDGERDVRVLGEMAKSRMRSKIPQLVEAFTGNFGEHHAFLCRLHLDRIDQLSASILALSSRIEKQMRPFSRRLDQLATIPGVGRSVAEVIIAETGGNMSRFATAAHLASWAGVCPGHHESAGKRKSGKTRHGNRWLVGALGTAAMAAARTKDTTYLGARYQRLAPRLVKKKAIVAVEHSILTAVWHMLTDDVDYADLELNLHFVEHGIGQWFGVGDDPVEVGNPDWRSNHGTGNIIAGADFHDDIVAGSERLLAGIIAGAAAGRHCDGDQVVLTLDGAQLESPAVLITKSDVDFIVGSARIPLSL